MHSRVAASHLGYDWIEQRAQNDIELQYKMTCGKNLPLDAGALRDIFGLDSDLPSRFVSSHFLVITNTPSQSGGKDSLRRSSMRARKIFEGLSSGLILSTVWKYSAAWSHFCSM